MQLPYNPIVALLGIYPRQMNCVHIQTCTRQMFTEALVIIAKNWTQGRCASAGRWLDRLWHIHAREYYSAIQREELPMQETI